MTFTIHILHPNAAITQILADNPLSAIIAPDYVMQKDIATWKAAGYTLPYPSPSGNATTMIHQYYMDEISTCMTGPTPNGCGRTYLDDSKAGSLAGTGPYTINSTNPTTNEIFLTARSGYWGGADPVKINAQIKTIDLKFVPDPKTAELDLQNAAKSGQAMAIDLPPDHLYDLANRTAWLNNRVLQSTIPGLSFYGPYSALSSSFIEFDLNVTNPLTGSPQVFQPFADQRFRLAFADSINMTQINADVNNNLGQVATNVIAPGLAPQGVFNNSLQPQYSFNPDQSAKLLLSAMSSPLTSFTLYNGTKAPAGYYNNSFGCNPLPSSGSCSHPLATPAINLYVPNSDTLDTQIFTQMAEVINNISSTYNMGLQVSVVPIPVGTMVTTALGATNPYYMYALGWFADYNWAVDFTGPMYAPNQAYPGPDKWNLTAMQTLYLQQVADNAANNITGIVQTTQQMNEIANQAVMYIWTVYGLNFVVQTSNIHGFQYNVAASTDAVGVAMQYFYYLY